MMRSTNEAASGRPAPRYAPIGVPLRERDRDVEADLGDVVHGLRHRARSSPIASVPPNPPYAPASPITRHRIPVIVPSRLSPSSTYWTCAAPCVIPIMFSERDSTHLTGRSSSQRDPSGDDASA